MATLSRRAVAS